MKLKISILYSWLVRTTTILLPNHPIFMRFRGFLYSLMMARCGKNFQVTSSAILNSLAGLDIGRDVYIAHNTVLIGASITIGSEVLIGPNCVVSGGNHTFKNGSFRFEASTDLPLSIGEGSWVAGNCTITGGASLPSGSVLAAGGVLTASFSEVNSVYGGIPAKFIKRIEG